MAARSGFNSEFTDCFNQNYQEENIRKSQVTTKIFSTINKYNSQILTVTSSEKKTRNKKNYQNGHYVIRLIYTGD